MHRAISSYARKESAAPSFVARTDDEIVRKYAHLVDRCARQVAARTGAKAEELWSSGALALLEAARRYDGSRDIPFEGFAVHRVRGAMLDEVRQMDRLSRRLRQRISHIESTRDDLAQELGRAPSRQEIAERAGVNASTIADAELAAMPVAAVNDELIAGEGEDLDALLIAGESRAQVAEALTRLPERLQLVLALRFIEELPLKDIAGALGVSEVRISQLVKAALQRLRAELVPSGIGVEGAAP